MNEWDQSDVAYETGPKEVPVKKKRSNSEFPGPTMDQGNKTAKGKEYVEKTYLANPPPLNNRHGEYR
jgi:hypothetical protein